MHMQLVNGSCVGNRFSEAWRWYVCTIPGLSLGNVRAAMRLITEHGDMGSLSLDSTQPDGRSVRGHLIDKHPTGISADPSAISDRSTAKEPHHIVFDQIDGPMVRSTMHCMPGSTGLSRRDARGWKRLCSSINRASNDAAAGGKLIPLHTWWYNLETAGPRYGYHPNLAKHGLLSSSSIVRLQLKCSEVQA